MGKRSNFERKPRDWYKTPEDAVAPLLRFLPKANGAQRTTYIEPCAGDGALIEHLKKAWLSCVYACDIDPKRESRFIEKRDILFFGARLPLADMIITNPPWEREPLHAMIGKFRQHAPTWLLIDADWAYTGQAKPYMKFCRRMVSIGRISWEGNGIYGKENCAWYLFGKEESETIFSA